MNEQMSLTLSVVMGHRSSVAESSSPAGEPWVGLSLHSSSENRLRAELMYKRVGGWGWGVTDRQRESADGISRRRRTMVGACLHPVFSISVPLRQLLGQNSLCLPRVLSLSSSPLTVLPANRLGFAFKINSEADHSLPPVSPSGPTHFHHPPGLVQLPPPWLPASSLDSPSCPSFSLNLLMNLTFYLLE